MTAAIARATARWAPSRSDRYWIAGAMLGGLFVGVLALAGLAVVALAVVVGLGVAANRRPYWAPIVLAVPCAVYLGVHLNYRIVIGGVPISVLNVLPLLALVAAFSLPHRERGRGVLFSRAAIPVALLAAGLLLGALVGLANSARPYQLVRVASIEVGLLMGCLAGLVAGGSRGWQKSMVTALYVAGSFAAVQQIVSFLYLVAVGRSLWQGLPFGADVLNVEQALASGLIAGTRDNYLATFIMLPALTLSVYRLTVRDVFVSALVLLAIAMSLSRSLWIAGAFGILIALTARGMSGRLLHPARVVKLGVVLLAVCAALIAFGGDAVNARLQQTGNEQDTSLQLRRAESTQALQAVTATPLTATVGIGTGVLLPPTVAKLQSPGGQTYLERGGDTDRNAILENQLLGRWTNFGLLSLLGTISLLVAAGWVAFTSLVKQRASIDHDLLAMGLALPPLLAVSPIAATLLQLHLTLPFWTLAGTILAARWCGPATFAKLRYDA